MQAKKLDEQMKVSLQTTQKYGVELDRQSDKVAESSHKTADQIAQAVSMLSGKIGEVGQAANDVKGKIDSSRTQLADENRALGRCVNQGSPCGGRGCFILYASVEFAL